MAGQKQPPFWQSTLDKLKSRLKRSPGAKPPASRRGGQGRAGVTPAQRVQDFVERARDILANLPEGSDEIAALLLLVFGVVSLLALLNFSPEEAVTSSWAQAIRQLFGLGSFVVAFGILGLAVMILLPKLNLELQWHFPWSRLLAIEIAFISLLALFHLLANDPEPRALARAGGGGGYVGWALSQLVAVVFDPISSTICTDYLPHRAWPGGWNPAQPSHPGSGLAARVCPKAADRLERRRNAADRAEASASRNPRRCSHRRD
jgi:hypothetical protein